MVKKIVVIGAGASGLTVLRHFGCKEDAFEVVCYEQLSNVAGLWNYSENITDRNHPTGSKYTAIYKNLKSDIPKQAMSFVDFPFPPELPSYVMHTDIKKYLKNYAKHFNLIKFIKFNKRVVSITSQTDICEDGNVWSVKIVDVYSKLEEELEFDAVIICNGHHFKPLYPKITDLDLFEGQLLHSQCYRNPEEFKNKNVLVVGGGPSGTDIVCDLIQFANKIWLSHRESESIALPDQIEQIGEISQVTFNSVITFQMHSQSSCNDSSQNTNPGEKESSSKTSELCLHGNTTNQFRNIFELHQEQHSSADDAVQNRCLKINSNKAYKIGPIDVIILCTGYEYSYLFLTADSGITLLSPQAVGPLYKDLISISRPSLCFIGLMTRVLSFPLFECQARFLVAVMEGRVSVPSSGPEMEAEVKAFNETKTNFGIDVWKKPLAYGPFQFTYMKELARIGGFEDLPNCYVDLILKVLEEMKKSRSDYKSKEYKLTDSGLYVEI